MESEFCFVYVTTASEAEAIAIAEAVVTERLAACANVLHSATSIYWWEGKIQRDTEAVLILKTQKTLFPALAERIKTLHSYTTPCIVALPIEQGEAAYLNWLKRQTTVG